MSETELKLTPEQLLKAKCNMYLDACKSIYACIEDGLLVRNISNDGQPGWAMKAIPLALAVKKLHDAIEEGEKPL